MTAGDNRPPIFIVGAPRSGTTLLAAMLGAHSRLSCGPETRFFRFLSKTDRTWLYDSWPGNAVEFLFSIRLMEPISGHYGLSREQIHTFLERKAPSVPAILSSLTKQFMVRKNKDRWVEKSPEHLMFVGDIRKYFPDSPIIRILRDPRDAALSMVKWANGPQDFLESLLLWREYDDKSAAFFDTDKGSYTVSYENLVDTPDEQLEKICEYIDEKYEPAMLDTSRSAANVVTRKETWKQLAAKPPDRTRIGVWRRELVGQQNRLAEALIGDRLITYGYEGSEEFERSAKVFPSLELLLDYRQALESFVDLGIRFWQMAVNDGGQVMIFVGEPDTNRWLSTQKPERWWDMLRILGWAVGRRLARERIYWVTRDTTHSSPGYSSKILSFTLGRVAERRIESSASLPEHHNPPLIEA